MNKNTLGDLYELMDEAGLNAALLSDSSKPFPIIVNDIRINLAHKLNDYIKKLPHEIKVKEG